MFSSGYNGVRASGDPAGKQVHFEFDVGVARPAGQPCKEGVPHSHHDGLHSVFGPEVIIAGCWAGLDY